MLCFFSNRIISKISILTQQQQQNSETCEQNKQKENILKMCEWRRKEKKHFT